MNASERLAEQYLVGLGFGAVKFEPDGNVPPDFLLDGRIAVEVRRLNQNYMKNDGSTEGLEELEIPLLQRLQRMLPTIGPSVDGESWFVGIDFRRPIEKGRALVTKIEFALRAFMKNSSRVDCAIQIAPNFSVVLFRASKGYGTFFLFGASCDDDSGGLVIGELKKNLLLCIGEKERKIAPYRSKYSEWWLVFTDHIGYSLSSADREAFCSEPAGLIHTFQKIILIDPRDYRRSFEV